MEAFGDTNGHSLSNSFSLYERYMKSFNVIDTFSCNQFPYGKTVDEPLKTEEPQNCETYDRQDVAEIDDLVGNSCTSKDQNLLIYDKKSSSYETDLHSNECESLKETPDNSYIDKLDIPGNSEDSKSESSNHPKPVIITSLITMENSNNAVDGIPLFRPAEQKENVFKLPCELSFNGTLKHVQKLKPIVDPITALSSSNITVLAQDNNLSTISIGTYEFIENNSKISINANNIFDKSGSNSKISNTDDQKSSESCSRVGVDNSTGDSQYSKSDKEKLSDSYSSLETSFDSGVRSPDMFSDAEIEDEVDNESAKFWEFIHEFESHDKKKIKKMEETLQGVPPPPSVTILKTDVNEMLKKYYTYLPNFGVDSNINSPETNSVTPTKRTAFIRIPTISELPEPKQEIAHSHADNIAKNDPVVEISTESNDRKISDDKYLDTESHVILPIIRNDSVTQDDAKIEIQSDNMTDNNKKESNVNEENNISNEIEKTESNLNKSSGKCASIKMCTQEEAKETPWPSILKCRFHDIHYNVTKYSERLELLALKCGERYVGAETDSSVTVFSGVTQSPTSASKRKAMRLKMAQAKSPGRRLSHLARRRHAFVSAANINEKVHNSSSRMVLIDKKKLVNTSDRKSPRQRRTPGRKTPGKKTPNKTPKTRSGGSSKKKAMRRLLLDQELTRSQPTRETSKRALFISPEQRKPVPLTTSSSVPTRAFKSKRALFGSPDTLAETKSQDGTRSDNFLKRKCSFDSESRSKIAKSLSFGGDSMSQPSCSTTVSRRASEMFSTKVMMAELDAQHRKKLLWAVSEALRVHGWRMHSPGFREKASALAQLTRRLLTMPHHAAKLQAPNLSTSDTLLKLARLHVFSIIQGKTIEECIQDEKLRLAEASQRVAGYPSTSIYQRFRPSTSVTSSQVKENLTSMKQEQPKSNTKNVLQDKVVNIDSNSNSSCGLSMLDKTALFKSNSMPTFEEAAKMRARRQISFDNVDFPKR